MTSQTTARDKNKITKALLTGGIIAGPFYLILGFGQAFTRPGFDLSKHPFSILSNGDLGWIQITNFLVTGLLIIGAAVGFRRVMSSGRGKTWAPILLGLYGIGLIGAAIFKADPSLGFPPGTPIDAMTISAMGFGHMISAMLGFASVIISSFIMARRFASFGERKWQLFSLFSGLTFLLTFIGVATIYNNVWSLVGFYIGVFVIFAWVTAVSFKLKREIV